MNEPSTLGGSIEVAELDATGSWLRHAVFIRAHPHRSAVTAMPTRRVKERWLSEAARPWTLILAVLRFQSAATAIVRS
jgi:hypothetical protein